MIKKALLITIIVLIIAIASRIIWNEVYPLQQSASSSLIALPSVSPQASPQQSNKPLQSPRPLPTQAEIPLRTHTFQSFNNCGPATYSMILSYLDITASQKELGDFLRPYQIPAGDNDDKSVSMDEIATHASRYDLTAYHRPNGTIEKLKQFINADHPIVLRTLLNAKEDIGHFIIIRGYDDTSQTIIFDDSYYGKNRTETYGQLEALWQPFNYEYLILTKNPITIEEILGQEKDSTSAWESALRRSQSEQQDSQSLYPIFNEAIASYYTQDYQNTIEKYQEIQTKLPKRMLWYQYEPILAYQKLGQHTKVFELTDAILNNQNRAYSELYFIRANSYLAQANESAAKQELDLAIKYNKNYVQAIQLRATVN